MPQPLKVAVIAHGLRAGGGVSIGANVIRSLLRLRPQYSYLIITPDDLAYSWIEPSDSCVVERFQHLSYLQRAYFDNVRLPQKINRYKPDIVFSLGNIPVPRVAGFQALLIHNAYLVYPDTGARGMGKSDRLSLLGQKLGIRVGLGSVNLVFCQTSVMRDRFRSTYNFSGQVLLMPNAISDFLADTPASELALPIDSGLFSLLSLSRYYPGKNLDLILRCYEEYRNDLADTRCFLTISPEQHPGARSLLRKITSMGLANHIVNLGPIAQSELGRYYRAAGALLMPTLIESFSGTYLEAMHYSTPILTSDRDFAREVCGRAALYFEPTSTRSMRDAIVALRDSASLRASLIAAGRERLAEMPRTWDEIVNSAVSDIETALLRDG